MNNYQKTIVYYLLVGLTVFGAIKLFPSGSCGPSLGVLIFLALNIVSIILFFVSLTKTFKNKENLNSTIIHFVGCCSLLTYFFTADQL
jgi:hypothetical protein